MFFIDLYDFIVRKILYKGELRKYTSKKRTSIYERIILSNQQKDDVDMLYVNSYGKRVPYIWHQHYTAFTGKFDKYYFPELLYIPELERYLNIYSKYAEVFSDKNVISCLAMSIGVLTPENLFSRNKGLYRNEQNECIDFDFFYRSMQNVGECFLKPSVDSNSGKGCFRSNFQNGFDVCNNMSLDDLLNRLGSDFIVQKIVKCHRSITDIYDKSVNTFRVITYRWKNAIYTIPSIMRIGQGGCYLDNAHAGGMFIAIEDDGTLHSKAFTEFRQEYATHPDSGVVFDGYKIPNFPDVLFVAKKMHGLIPQVGVINWDFTINEFGNPVLIEGNMIGGSIWLSQMAHGKGPFGERTPEILCWMKKMRSLSHEEKCKHAFGY